MEGGAPLETRELAHLLVRMESAVAATAKRMKGGMIVVAGGFAVMALYFGLVFHTWGSAAFIGLFAVGFGWIGRQAARKTAPERMQPVLDAVREAPERVVSIRHYTTADSRYFFVSHWLEVKTAEHRLIMKSNDEWEMLLGYLRRRCPQATVTDVPR